VCSTKVQAAVSLSTAHIRVDMCDNTTGFQDDVRKIDMP
jgi:hypothetical protein